MSEKITALAAELEAIRAEIVELDSVEEPTDEQATRATELIAAWDAKKTEHDALVERAEKVEAVRAAALNPRNVERAVPAAPEVIVKRDVFENLDGVARGLVPSADLISRAKTAIEESTDIPDAHRESASRMVAGRPDIARIALLHGNPAYQRAFEKIMESPESFQAFLEPDEAHALRTALSTTAGNGGYAIPFLLDPSVILTNDGTAGSIRSIARVEQGTSNKWQGLTSAGVTAEWLAEGSAAADKSPSFTQPAITAYKAAAYVFGSYEVFQNTNLAAELPMLIADAKGRIENDAFAIGSGSAAPKGVVTAAAAVTASRVAASTAGALNTVDVYNVIAGVPPRHRSTSSWLANFATYSKIRQLDTSGGSAFWANLGANQPEVLLGRPTYESSEMSSSYVAGQYVLVAGDFAKYLVYDVVGATTLEYIQNVVDTTTGRPTGQRGWFATWRTGGDVLDVNAFRLLKL